MTKIYVMGLPGVLGGASTESWHAIRLWRHMGCAVSVIPTWSDHAQWRAKLSDVGAEVIMFPSPESLRYSGELSGNIVVGFCSGPFLQCAPWLREAGAKLVWINCMNVVWGNEIEFNRTHGPYDAYVYQSEFQYRVVTSQLERLGVPANRFFRIRGSFTPGDYPFAPRQHHSNEVFVVGRHARDDVDKWHGDMWRTYQAISYRPLAASVMGCSERVLRKLGPAPDWVEVLETCARSTQEFLNRLHCFFPINGPDVENWPQAGLEAMSQGVPVVAEALGGWNEMIVHGETGFLGKDLVEMAAYADRLARDEPLRQQMISRAHERLMEELANPRNLQEQWAGLFTQLSSHA